MKKTRILILGIIIGVIATLTVVVYASETLFESKDISYTNGSSEVNNVQDAVDELYDKTSKYKYANLADVVSVGDYVAYDAGTWASSADKPTSQGQFGGYTAGQNKANSVPCRNTTSLKGWRVLNVDSNIKTVTLVHAGQPECYYHEYGQSTASVTNLNNRANSEYLNDIYADSAHMMNYDDALAITGSEITTADNLRNTGSGYWLATPGTTGRLYCVLYTGNLFSDSSLVSDGVRPIVVLKSNILTTGKGLDAVGQEAWTLVKP